jgi:hypothetical protein
MLLRLLMLKQINDYYTQLSKLLKALQEFEALRAFGFIQSAKYLEAVEQREKALAAQRNAERQRSCASGAVYS